MKMLRLLFAFLLLAPLTAQAQNFPARDKQPVVDAAGVLSPEQIAAITAQSEQINEDTTRQFVVATIPDLEGYEIADYGYQLGRHWGLGDKQANNGIILIVAPKDRKVRIEVGYGLEPIMTDALSSQIINTIILPKFKAGDLPGGIVDGAAAIAEQMKAPLEVAEAKAKAAADQVTTTRTRTRSSGGFPFGLLFWGVVLVFILGPMILRRKRGRRYRGGDGGSSWPIVLWSIANEISRSSGSSGGGGSSGWGGGGGSSWGGGGGGGGGGFSGGGGSFGGGGASGSW